MRIQPSSIFDISSFVLQVLLMVASVSRKETPWSIGYSSEIYLAAEILQTFVPSEDLSTPETEVPSLRICQYELQFNIRGFSLFFVFSSRKHFPTLMQKVNNYFCFKLSRTVVSPIPYSKHIFFLESPFPNLEQKFQFLGNRYNKLFSFISHY